MIWDGVANCLMYLWNYYILVTLDPKNHLSKVKIACYVIAIATCFMIAEELLHLNVSFIATIILGCSIYSLMKQKFYLNHLIDYTVAAVLQLFINMFFALPIYPLLGNVVDNKLLMVILSFLFCTVFYFIYKRKVVPDRWTLMYLANRRSVAILLVCLSIISNTILYYYNDHNEMFWEQKGLIFSFFVVAYVLSLLVLYNIMKRYTQQKELAVYEEYGSYLENMIEQISKRKHEYYNQINTIMGIIQIEDEKEAVSNVLEYCEVILHEKQNEQADAGVKGPGIVSAVIHRKAQQAELEDIKFNHLITKPFPLFPLSTYSLAELLINLLNNAFEHVSKLEGTKEVSLVITEEKIEVANTISGELNMTIINKGGSSKGYGRGYGLTNIREITEDAGGNLEIRASEDMIIFTAQFDSIS